jgi:ribosomal-protein-alanine N-acetyltransferase
MKTIIKLKNIEEFDTARLHAKKIGENDFHLILPMYQNKTVMETLGGLVSESVVKERFLKSLAGWEKNGFDVWLWFEKNSNKLVGRAGLRMLELQGEQVTEVGYALLPEFWNNGFATEIASASIEIAFEILKLNEIVCFTSVTNKSSQRVMEKSGFKYNRNFIYLDEEHMLYLLSSEVYHQNVI